MSGPDATALLCTTGGVALDELELGQRGISLRAVRELARQHARLEQALALHQVSRLARGLASPRRGQRLFDDAPAFRRILVEVLRQAFGQRQRDMPLDLGVAELAL